MTNAQWAILAVVCAACPVAAIEPDRSAKSPPSESQDRRIELAAEHAHLLSQIKWTPVADTMPTRSGGYFKKGTQYIGAPYSSVRSEGRYIGFDISLRTFLAAVENPQSVVYTENLAGKVPNAAPYYGTVCSAFTSYSLQCGNFEVSRRHGPAVSSGVVSIEPPSAQAARVGDVIYTPHRTLTSGSHVALVTAVERDEVGRVTRVRVEESRSPTVQTTERTAGEFDSHLAAGNKQLFRVTDLDAWRGANRAESFLFPNYEADSVTPAINRMLLLDLGDWVPYRKGRPVKFNVMNRDVEAVKSLVVERDGKLVEAIPLDRPGVYERTFVTCGDYSAYVARPDGSASARCEFAVCGLDLHLPAERVALRGSWDVRFTSDHIKPIAVYLWSDADGYGRHSLFLSDDQRCKGVVTVPADLLKMPGNLQVWLIGEHRLGRLKVRKDVSLLK